jgi:cytochrome c556
MMRYLIAALVLVSSSSVLGDPIKDAVEARQGYFIMLSTNMHPLSAMAKGELDYDEAAAAMYGSNIEVLSQYTLPMHFPKGSSTGELGKATGAKAKIWTNFEDFNQKFADFQKAAEGAGESVKGGKSNVGPVVQKIGKTCKACHDEYRVKND